MFHLKHDTSPISFSKENDILPSISLQLFGCHYNERFYFFLVVVLDIYYHKNFIIIASFVPHPPFCQALKNLECIPKNVEVLGYELWVSTFKHLQYYLQLRHILRIQIHIQHFRNMFFDSVVIRKYSMTKNTSFS